jgi:hypothetical protein
VPLPAFTAVSLAPDPAEALSRVPAEGGVAQILGPDGTNLLVGRAANLRRWAASHLGRGKPVPKGKRPPTDLSPVATAIAYAPTTSPFQQRLVYERLMARYVPLSARRDLKPPAFLHLDPAERFPRVSVRKGAEGPSGPLFGPFRDRRAAEKAQAVLHKLYPLRPCDYTFEPEAALPLGLGCLYAQVRSCAAPCLVRVAEADYRALAVQVAEVLARPDRRPQDLASLLPPWVSAAGSRGVVVARGAEGVVELYPVRAGRVLDEAAILAPAEAASVAIESIRWDDQTSGRETTVDWPWLSAWLHSPPGRTSWIACPER